MWWFCVPLMRRHTWNECAVGAVERSWSGAHVAECGFVSSRSADSERAGAVACTDAFGVVDGLGVDDGGGE